MRRMSRPALLLVLLAACAHAKPEEQASRCAESRSLSCLTPMECSYDEARGCSVCQCAKQWAAPQDTRIPSSLPPDSNAQPQ
jgi:hypothetical protein